ncbi:class I SAM-dependent methyltransferase [Altererythrobacter ishigakiensis]|uniref:Methyltransferase family protein n=1 Tax=Altererythrobacter ishigakiensis TaxID=476157 RepID=A0A562USQ0_9SPHN|nr:class I SAM-dependent methyltransferase [Altererythrobacter ishigakiensis]TWJ08631.1 methyltransferase family protein [Altererythrobacter ishigakiensis]
MRLERDSPKVQSERETKIEELLACPMCGGMMKVSSEESKCAGKCRRQFRNVMGQPVLIDFSNSLVSELALFQRKGGSVLRRGGLPKLLSRILSGGNPVAARFAARLDADLRGLSNPRLLVIGGGEKGKGTDAIYSSDHLELFGTDIYASELTHVVADAHKLPFANEAFDAVWIQAVLEHVLEPKQVVSEIKRILKPGGVIFADTPFLWPVHEGAYDFTRWTMNGYRWLLRDFDEIESGYSSGAGQNLLLAIRYAIRAWTGSGALALCFTLPFFWLRFLDRFGPKRSQLDAAAGIYFYGRLSENPLVAQALPRYYENQLSSTNKLSSCSPN